MSDQRSVERSSKTSCARPTRSRRTWSPSRVTSSTAASSSCAKPSRRSPSCAPGTASTSLPATTNTFPARRNGCASSLASAYASCETNGSPSARGPTASTSAGVDDRSAVRYGGLAPADAVARALAGRDPEARAGPAGAPAAFALRCRAVRRGTAALGAHARRADLAVQLPGAPAAAVRGRPSPPRTTRRSTSAAAPGTGARRCGSAPPAEITHVTLESAGPDGSGGA